MQPRSKTPGVYTSEQNAFPNPVVEVETAIPAFICYTQQASYNDKDLISIPTRVESLKEFEDYFGTGATQQFDLLATYDATKYAVAASTIQLLGAATKPQYLVPHSARYYLYSAIQLFYQNGGSTCYIVSIGNYDDSDSTFDQFLKAIDLLVYEQDPTMLLCPDALRLDMAGYNQVMEHMLEHCALVKSRVALLDVYQGAVTTPAQMNQQNTIDNFRDGVGQNNLNYGIAYFPWVQTSILDSNEDVSFLNLTPDALDVLKAALNSNQPAAGTLAASVKTVTDQNAALTTNATETAGEAAKAAGKAATDADAAIKDAADLENARKNLTANPPVANAQDNFNTAQTKAAASANKAAQSKQEAAQSAADAIAADKKAADAAAAITANIVSVSTALAGGSNTTPQGPTTAMVPTLDGSSKENIFDQAKDLLDAVKFTAANGGVIDSKGLINKRLYINNALVAQFPEYALAMKVVARYLNTMPVAPAMAGVYTAVDSSRGVWKAPANLSLNTVVAPTVSLSDSDQGNLNVDALTGKSINAIRTFRGLGTMVWGGRTLDGNSQDWRYINVRRTMIMIEQSVKLAARSYVFEPNDANTWTTMKSMINNFLNTLWKQGALAGATPAEAYTVQIGLGSTMTPNDILDGYLNVTVLVALVHPAEFIVLTFKQEMQTS